MRQRHQLFSLQSVRPDVNAVRVVIECVGLHGGLAALLGLDALVFLAQQLFSLAVANVGPFSIISELKVLRKVVAQVDGQNAIRVEFVEVIEYYVRIRRLRHVEVDCTSLHN